MTDLDKFQNRQSKLLLFFALSFGLWQGATLIVEAANLSGAAQHVAIGTMILSGLVWFVITVMLFGGGFSRRHAEGKALEQDEWRQHLTVRTMLVSYLTLISVIGAGMLWTLMVGSIDGAVAFRGLLIIGVLVPLILFYVFDKTAGE